MYVCVYVHACMYVCMCYVMYECVYLCVCIYAYMYLCVCVCVCVTVHMRTYVLKVEYENMKKLTLKNRNFAIFLYPFIILI